MEHQKEMELINKIRDGETDLFSIFLKQYANKVYLMTFQIIGCREDAEELTQDVFIKAFNKLYTFKGTCRFSTWLYRIAYNTAISEIRKKKIVLPAIDDRQLENISDDDLDTLLNQDENEQMLSKLKRCVELLDHDEQALIKLFYNENKSVKELAEIIEISETNVKVRMHRVRKKLYLLMNTAEDEER